MPQISVVTGVSAGGGAYSPALTDFVVMTESARMFLTGPRVVEAALGEQVSMEELGGPGVHSRNGVCQLVAEDDADAAAIARELLGLLPRRIGEPPPAATRPACGRPGTGEPAAGRSRRPAPRLRRPRSVARSSTAAAAGALDAGWARNMVTALARIDGRPVGVIANQPRYLGGVIDAAAAEKAALFVNACSRSACRWSCWSTPPGSCPARARSAAA